MCIHIEEILATTFDHFVPKATFYRGVRCITKDDRNRMKLIIEESDGCLVIERLQIVLRVEWSLDDDVTVLVETKKKWCSRRTSKERTVKLST